MACLAGIVFLTLSTRSIASYAIANPVILGVLTFLAVGDVAVVFIVRRIIVNRSERTLIAVPQDPKAVARWYAGYLITYCIGESIAIYGVVLHVLGFGFSRVAPFFVAGFVLILFLPPRRPVWTR